MELNIAVTSSLCHRHELTFQRLFKRAEQDMQRIIDRSELRSEDASPSSTPEPDALERLKQLNDFDFVESGPLNEAALAKIEGTTKDEELDFRLFATSKPAEKQLASSTTQRIRLRSPSVDNTKAGFLQPTRDSGYYFAPPLSPTEKTTLETSALTGEQVLARSQSPWPGCTYPWRLLDLPTSSLYSSLRIQQSAAFRKLVSETEPARRKRPGKKYRIKLRTKHAALQSKQDAKNAAADAKEAAEREKRTRRNREKKLKKKMREKAKKGEVSGDGDAEALEAGDAAVDD